MWHTLAWTVSLADSTLTDVTPVTDTIVPVVNAHFMPPDDLSVYAGVAYGTNLQRVRVTTPRLRQISPIFMRPLQPTLIAANDANNVFYDRNPLRFRAQEEIVVEAIQNSGGAQRTTICMFLGRNLVASPGGDVYVCRATSTTAVTANVWSQLTYTMDSNLPAGRYAVQLIEHQSTNSQAVRAIYDNQFYRPGFPGTNALTSRLSSLWYEYPFGVCGYFVTYSFPRIEVLCNAADAAHELYLHVVPLPG